MNEDAIFFLKSRLELLYHLRVYYVFISKYFKRFVELVRNLYSCSAVGLFFSKKAFDV